MLTFWIGTIVFFGTYLLIATEKLHKTTAALLGAVCMMLFILPGPGHSTTDSVHASAVAEKSGASVSAPAVMPSLNDGVTSTLQKYSKLDTFSRYSNFDVIFTLAGMMLLVNLLSGTGLFQFVAIKCAKLAKGSPIRMMILLVSATALLSAFLDNVTTILLVAPVTLLVAGELAVPVIPFLMAETMASNIGGTATLIGDPPNLIIGSVANLDFMAFLVNLAPVVLIIMAIYCVVLGMYYSKRMHVTVEKRARIMELDEYAAISDHANLLRGGIVMLLTIAGFLIHGWVGLQPCVVAMAGATLAFCICKVDVDHALEKIEWSTLFFFMALFILVRGAEECGLMTKIGSGLGLLDEWPVPATIMVIMWGSALAAALMNNVSFTAAMSAVVLSFVENAPAFRDDPSARNLLWWALALAVCLGGNASLVGAAANLVTVGIAEKNGHPVGFGTFLRYGLPVTVGSLLVASGYILVRYYYFC